MVQNLTIEEIRAKLKELPSWNITDDSLFLIRKYKFKNWLETVEFINQISEIAEKLNHHPNINFTYGFCEIKIQTHIMNGLTNLDFELAQQISNL